MHAATNELNPSNPFGEPSCLNIAHQAEHSYPVCLATPPAECPNTPFSRLSSASHQSEGVPGEMRNQAWNAESICSKLRASSSMKTSQKADELKEYIRDLEDTLNDLKCYTVVIEKRNQQVVLALEKEKLKSAHLEQALHFLRKDDQSLEKKANQNYMMLTEIKTQLDRQRDVSLALAQKLEQSQAENNYLKELILLANNNYEVMEGKYLSISQKYKKIEEENLSKQKELNSNISEMKQLLANLINSPNTHFTVPHNLSFGGGDENSLQRTPFQSTNRKQQKKPVEDLYRGMFMKTLKGNK